jgi:GTP-binding protein EngB required for normal cell division
MSDIASLWKKSQKKVDDKFNDGLSGVNISSNEYFSSFATIFKGIFKQNIDEEFQTPKICVIGNTSSGKSSLLENITKTPIFPRNKTLCTKQPIHLSLKNSDTEEYIFNRKPVNKDSIRKTIEDEFLKNDTIVDKTIEVCISGHDLINFEFIDFPGLCSHPPALKESSISLTEKYLKDNNIILCVIPSHITHLSSYEPIALIEKHNMKHNTILVFTMADKVVEEDIGENIIARILNESSEIDTGEYLACSVIINRSHTNNKSLAENDEFSDSWFNTNVLEKIPDNHEKKDEIKSMLGVSNLMNNLNVFYKKFIDSQWIPTTISRLENNIKKYKVELDNLGIVPDIIDKGKFTKYYSEKIIPELINLIKKKTYSFEYRDFNDFKLYLEHINNSIDGVIWPEPSWLTGFNSVKTPLNNCPVRELLGLRMTSSDTDVDDAKAVLIKAEADMVLLREQVSAEAMTTCCEVDSLLRVRMGEASWGGRFAPQAKLNALRKLESEKRGITRANECLEDPMPPTRNKITQKKLTVNDTPLNENIKLTISESNNNSNEISRMLESLSDVPYKSDSIDETRWVEQQVYDSFNLNIIRFNDINETIISKITEIYKEQLKYFVDFSRHHLMSIAFASVGALSGASKCVDTIKLQHSMCIHEMLNKDYTKYKFFEVIEESATYVDLRKKLNGNILESSVAINKLTALKDGINSSNKKCQSSESIESIENTKMQHCDTAGNTIKEFDGLVNWKYTTNVITGKIGTSNK